MEDKDKRYAVLIDADNISQHYIRHIMDEVTTIGVATYKRIYGDWTKPQLGVWKSILLDYSVTPIQQYGYTTGKNATDSAMIIDAMDILYGGKMDGFVLLSSDSDFTRLAIRLREAGMYVIGIGERKTPNPFIVACDKFIYIEVIRERANKSAKEAEKTVKPETRRKKAEPQKKAQDKQPEKQDHKTADKPAEKRVPPSIINLISDSISDLADDDGYAALSDLGNLIIKKQPDFDPRNFGFGKLSNMMKFLTQFEVEVRPTSDPHVKPMYIKDKDA